LGSAVGIFGTSLQPETPHASASLPQLTSTGSSFAGVAISQWEGQFNELYGGNVNFTVSSSVVGLNNFCQQTVDMGASDISYSTLQSNCVTSPTSGFTTVPYPTQYMPDVAGGLAFEYNLNAQNGQKVTNLVLNASALAGIFSGSIKNWNDQTIQSLNPNIPLPNQPITAYFRNDPSGENYLLSDYFLHTDPGPITSFQQAAQIPNPGQPSATWASFPAGTPPQYSTLVPVNGSDAASQGPLHTQGGISYVETAYAKNVGLPVASMLNQAGNPVLPSSYNVAVALTNAILYSDLTQNLGGVYTNPAADAYPISAYSYLVAQCVPSQAAAQNFSCDGSGGVTMGAAQGAELAQFIEYVACLGQQSMPGLGYSPLPANLVEDDFQAAGRLPGGTTPPPPTAANCKNPYIDGQLQPVGGPQIIGSSNPGGSDVGTSTGSAAAAGSAAHGGTAASSTGAASSAQSAAAASAAATSKYLHKHSYNPFDAVADTYRQGELSSAASKALLGWSPLELALWSTVIAAIIIGVPFALWWKQRRRNSAEEVP
jgi:phosphate transport system substrate-binding protein